MAPHHEQPNGFSTVRISETLRQALEERRSRLMPEQLTALRQRLRGEHGSLDAAGPRIPRRTAPGPAPLTFSQARLWFLFELDPELPTYNEAFATRISGRLDVAAFDQAVRELVRRHAILRTTFQLIDGEPAQIVASVGGPQLRLVDLAALAADSRQAETARLVKEEAARPFDLRRDFPLRATLLRIADDEHVLLLTQHHISYDGWSASVRNRELGVLYDAFKCGGRSPLPELPLQFADFAEWQRAQLTESRREVLLDYWRRQLAAVAPLQLPTDRRRSPGWSSRGKIIRTSLSAQCAAALRRLSRQERVTAFVVNFAAFCVLLHRYARQTDLLIGTPVTSREHPDLEQLIGFFVDILLLRADLSGQPTFRELLQRVSQMLLEAHAHKDLPIEHIITELRPKRARGSSPLCSILFSWEECEPTKARAEGFGGLELTELGRTLTNTAKFELTLAMQRSSKSIDCFWEYNNDLFDDETIARLAGRFETLLSSAMADPDLPLASLPLAPSHELTDLARTSNQTRQERPSVRLAHEQFALQAASAPDSTAVICGNARVTYRQLSERSGRIASYLRHLGVGPEVLVGILMEPCPDAIAALLGVMMAGGAYLPVDPATPPQRVSAILHAAGIDVLLIQHHLRARLSDIPGRVCCLGDSDDVPAAVARPHHKADIGPANLAYVIYTSGSTGTPKGVMISHGALAQFTLAARDLFQLSSADRVLQFASLAFDAAAEEIYPVLACGGTLVMMTQEMRGSVRGMLRQCAEQRVTVLDLPTAYWHELTREMADARVRLPSSARLVIIGGERASPDYAARWRAYVGGIIRLTNTYGPTEATVTSLAGDVTADEIDATREIAIGRPIANTRAYVLDEELRPVPAGIPGELCIGGVGLARGYLGRPDLTAERFVPDPFSEEPGLRLYRTGDLVRYRPNGAIEFLGRIDRQVKIRGFRVELGEVEATLSRHPDLKQVAVAATDDRGAGLRLTVYVVPTRPPGPDLGELRRFLEQRLPDYMLPTAVFAVPELQLGPHGKVDYQALTRLEGVQLATNIEFIPPRTAAEETLARIWADVLRLDRIGVLENFFELGGDSILSLQIISRANRAGLRLTVKQLFDHQTIAGLAAVAGTAPAMDADQGAITGPVPLTPIQHWFFAQALPNPHHFNQARWLELPAAVDANLLEAALQRLLVHHDALRLCFVPGPMGWRQINRGVEMTVALNRFDFSRLVPAEQDAACAVAAAGLQVGFDLEQGPLLAAGLFEFGSDKPPCLLLVIHHLVVDGVSWGILLEDLQAAYDHLGRGAPVALPAKTTSYQSWAARLAEHVRSGGVLRELEYWTSLPFVRAPCLPLDDPGGANIAAAARTVSFGLDEEETSALLQRVPRVYETQINDVLLTALLQAFAPWTGARTLLVDVEGHGRETLFEGIDLSRTVGWFTSIFPALLELPDGNDPGHALAAVKEQLRRIPNKGVGYGLLCYMAGDDVSRRLACLPQAEVSFNYLGQFPGTRSEQSLSMAGRSVGPTRDRSGHRRYKLDLEGCVKGGRMQFDWTYSLNLHRTATIETMARGYVAALRFLIGHCQSQRGPRYTASDFPLAGFDDSRLDTILRQIKTGE